MLLHRSEVAVLLIHQVLFLISRLGWCRMVLGFTSRRQCLLWEKIQSKGFRIHSLSDRNCGSAASTQVPFILVVTWKIPYFVSPSANTRMIPYFACWWAQHSSPVPFKASVNYAGVNFPASTGFSRILITQYTITHNLLCPMPSTLRLFSLVGGVGPLIVPHFVKSYLTRRCSLLETKATSIESKFMVGNLTICSESSAPNSHVYGKRTTNCDYQQLRKLRRMMSGNQSEISPIDPDKLLEFLSPNHVVVIG